MYRTYQEKNRRFSSPGTFHAYLMVSYFGVVVVVGIVEVNL